MGRAALVRMSSLPASLSSMKPKVWALASLTARKRSTVRLRRLYRAISTTRAKTVRTSPARHSSRKRSTRMPARRMVLPRMCMTNVEKKPPSSSASPSMRSIISPGVRRLWKDMSSFMQWRARSPRSALVAVHPTRPLVYVVTTLTACWKSATAVNRTAIQTRLTTGLPPSASSMK